MSIFTVSLAGKRCSMEIMKAVLSEKDSVMLYFMFWAAYIPLSLLLMQFIPANFTIVMLIGVKIILAFLLFRSHSRKRVPVKKETPRVMAEIVQAEPVQVSESFGRVFDPGFGKESFDLD